MKTIHPSQLNGSIRIQPSKSVLHRAIICAALAKGESVIENFLLPDDIRTTLQAMRDMGFCDFRVQGGRCEITGGANRKTKEIIDCGESGSTLRMVLPLACDGQRRIFTGRGRLMQRPMAPYEAIFAGQGIAYAQNGDTITLEGVLKPGRFEMAGDVSSQFISGLLLQLPTLQGDSSIIITTELESAPYIDLTRQYQEKFHVESGYDDPVFHIPGGQQYAPANLAAEGDYSHAAFFAVAAAMGGTVDMAGLRQDSRQGDRQILDILNCMGAAVAWTDEIVRVSRNTLKPLEIDVSQIPDLVPALAVLACAAHGKTKIYNAARLRFKESDRLYAIAAELEKLGADVVEYEDSLVVNGTGTLRGGRVATHNDHRIAMALSIAACIADGDIILDEPDVVRKSAPNFFEQFISLGGKTD